MEWMNDEYYLKRAYQISIEAVEKGNFPFGAVLVDKNGKIIMEQGNVEMTESKCTGHAETQLIEKASIKYSKDFLWDCTLFTTVEPCAMCSGAIYWGNVGKVVYGISEKELFSITGNNINNPTLDMPSVKVFEAGQKDIKVSSISGKIHSMILEQHKRYW
jgi:tRNA(Arg) A34 adenosine deaminase TadA